VKRSGKKEPTWRNLKPYEATIDRWVCSDVTGNDGIPLAHAQKAMADYRM